MSKTKNEIKSLAGSDAPTCCVSLSVSERIQLTEILERRANEIASFKRDMEEKATEKAGTRIEFYALPGSVGLAISREIQRLRKLADKIRPPSPEDEDDE